MSDLSSVLHHIAKHRHELVLRYGVHILDALLHVQQTAVQCVESNGRTVEPKQEYQVLQQLPGEQEKETIIKMSVILKKKVWENLVKSNFYSLIFIWTIFY